MGRAIRWWVAAAVLAMACAQGIAGCGDGDRLPSGGSGGMGAHEHDAAGSDAGRGGHQHADSGGDDIEGTDERDPYDDGGLDGDSGVERDPVIGVAFQALRARTEDGQTVALQGVTGVAAMPDGSGLVAWEKSGRITHYGIEDDGLVLRGEVRLDGVYTKQDCGLVTFAFDPEWSSNHFVFVAHCVDLKHAAVLRYEFDGEHYDSIAETASPVIEIGDEAATKAWHNIGSIGFFDDEQHSMWLLAGEKFVSGNAQDLSVDLGKVLRIVPRRERELTGYEPHPNNPFAGDPSSSSGPDIYAWGLRSPWRGTIDSDGCIFMGDVGERTEEVNVALGPGHNFGWASIDGPCKDRADCENFSDPAVSWTRGSDHRYRVADNGATPSTARVAWVGAYYDGRERDRYEDFLDDTVLFSDMCIGFVRALSIDEQGGAIRDEHVGHLSGLSGATVGSDGYLYVTSFGGCTASKNGVGSGIYRVLPRRAEDPLKVPPARSDKPLAEDPLGPMPLRLSESGLFQGPGLSEPIARALRYEPTLPLWSSGADKERFVLLPEGTKVDNSDRQAWDFPPGTLFVKTFSLVDLNGNDNRIETRIIRRTETGYEYYGYKWTTSGDADLLSLELNVPVRVQVGEGDFVDYQIPSAFDCRTCHESNGTVIIGFDELRLNGPRADRTGAQLAALAAAGVFEAELPSDPAHVAGPDALTEEVLGYLHGNCAHCHNRSPNASSPLSLEHDMTLASTIGVETAGSGQAAGIRVVPGEPDESILFQAFWRDENGAEVEDMPPVGVQVLDTAAARMLREWITALPAP
jgi:hypothetical protein